MSRQVIKVVGFDQAQNQGLVAKSKASEKNFEINKEPIPKLVQDGDVLVEPLWVSVDPYLRGRLSSWNNKSVVSGQVVRVIESKNKEYPVGTALLIYLSWSDHNVVSAQELKLATVIPPKIVNEQDNDDEKKKIILIYLKYLYLII